MEQAWDNERCDFALMGQPVMDVRVFIEPRHWLSRFLWRWLKVSKLRMTWVELTDETLRAFAASTDEPNQGGEERNGKSR
ncbi:hypothetical protein LCGC14_2195660 [marine sediment metagenome]|uniref:Uncharacterized protein n=1 Tax=marine sediment metagenome TaxID=412755 RepID=A0A0F9E5C3_9ZZZZ